MIRTFPPPVPGMEGFRFRVATRSCGGPRYRTARAFELSKCRLYYQTQQLPIKSTAHGHCTACHTEGGEAIVCRLRADCPFMRSAELPCTHATRVSSLCEELCGNNLCGNNPTIGQHLQTTLRDKHDALTLDERSYVLEGNCAVYKVQHNGS